MKHHQKTNKTNKQTIYNILNSKNKWTEITKCHKIGIKVISKDGLKIVLTSCGIFPFNLDASSWNIAFVAPWVWQTDRIVRSSSLQQQRACSYKRCQRLWKITRNTCSRMCWVEWCGMIMLWQSSSDWWRLLKHSHNIILLNTSSFEQQFEICLLLNKTWKCQDYYRLKTVFIQLPPKKWHVAREYQWHIGLYEHIFKVQFCNRSHTMLKGFQLTQLAHDTWLIVPFLAKHCDSTYRVHNTISFPSWSIWWFCADNVPWGNSEPSSVSSHVSSYAGWDTDIKKYWNVNEPIWHVAESSLL